MINKKYNLSGQIIKAAMNVYNELGYGFLEKSYQNALQFELKEQHISFETEKHVNVTYKNHNVGDYYIDLFAADKIVIELKSTNMILTYHIKQVKNYLRALNVSYGLVFNFAPRSLEWKKIFNPELK